MNQPRHISEFLADALDLILPANDDLTHLDDCPRCNPEHITESEETA